MKPYSKELVNFIEQNRMEYTTLEMVKLIKKKFKKDMTSKTLRKYYDRHNLDFKKIYKRTDKNVNAKPIGTESNPDKNGLVRVKINKKQWQFKSRYLYEKYNKRKLLDNEVVIFLDGNKTNYKKENLMAVPRKEAITFYGLTSGKIKNKKLTETGILIAKVKNKIAEFKK